MQFTFADAMDHALAYAGDDATAAGTNKCRRSVQSAYNVIPTRHEWVALWQLGRVITSGPYNTGTVAFDLTGGAYERVLTLTGGTWPSWANHGYVIINNIPYEVEDRKSDTQITITAAQAPSDDIAAGATFSLVRDRYPLPTDFVAGDETVLNEVGKVLEYTHPRLWAVQRRVNTGPGSPWQYSYLGSNTSPGSLLMALWPPPDGVYTIDFLYRRKMRPLVFQAVQDGTVSTSGMALTGQGTAFKAGMVGSYIRFSDDNQTAPTGDSGESPASFETRITGYTSATSLTLESAPPTDFAGVKYVISDPVDLEQTAMLDYFLREIEYQYRTIARMVVKDKDEDGIYQLSLTRAMEADNRTSSRAAIMRRQTRRSGFIHYPIDFGV